MESLMATFAPHAHLTLTLTLIQKCISNQNHIHHGGSLTLTLTLTLTVALPRTRTTSSHHLTLTLTLTQGHPVQISEDPGRFVCNYIYYQSLLQHKEDPVLFVHVPSFETIGEADQPCAIPYQSPDYRDLP